MEIFFASKVFIAKTVPVTPTSESPEFASGGLPLVVGIQMSSTYVTALL